VVQYSIEIKRNALKDLKAISTDDARRIMETIRALENDLQGDVKRLTGFTPEFRLRVGIWRVLFEVEAGKVIVHRVKHRRDAYRRS